MMGHSASNDVAFLIYGIFPILSHFSRFLGKQGWFWGWSWSLEFSICQSTIEIYRFWFKWGVNHIFTWRSSWDVKYLSGLLYCDTLAFPTSGWAIFAEVPEMPGGLMIIMSSRRVDLTFSLVPYGWKCGSLAKSTLKSRHFFIFRQIGGFFWSFGYILKCLKLLFWTKIFMILTWTSKNLHPKAYFHPHWALCLAEICIFHHFKYWPKRHSLHIYFSIFIFQVFVSSTFDILVRRNMFDNNCLIKPVKNLNF